ncbi:MAG: anthranilate phosphoribosyltransferase [Rhodospirillaceae bacterium TMED8]|mgnify:CR=1 FL=1|nr:anthranilate phosphoribosyltransferase [Magnetovibrio sp.]OUT51653.1 MAG: anthranilate phosphoribosyltransferase [Rhodospirillaceae bacterium TMED8]|tara:strand:- start:1887 stop:2924 length:1038 start_codon:yes stop_codon:yes gene_type:complete
MSEEMKPFLAAIAGGARLSVADSQKVFTLIMSGKALESQIAALLMGMRMRGESIQEISGAVHAMRAKMMTVSAPEGAIDIVGTGGDGLGTLNISTATALVVAGCGVPVAKHGNRAVSSKSGASDVLMELGINLNCNLDYIERSISEAKIGFLMAPRHHSAMGIVVPVRSAMGVRTIFNILGPMSNPAKVKRQLTGTFDRALIEPMAQTLANVGCEATWVVHGADGLDELTTTGTTYVAALKDGKITTFEVTPGDAGLARANLDDLRGGDAAANAVAIRSLVAGEKGPYRDVVLLNAAASLVVASKADDLKAGVLQASASIDDGKAEAALNSMVEITNFSEVAHRE